LLRLFLLCISSKDGAYFTLRIGVIKAFGGPAAAVVVVDAATVLPRRSVISLGVRVIVDAGYNLTAAARHQKRRGAE